jgi:signal transduction histidine kinase
MAFDGALALVCTGIELALVADAGARAVVLVAIAGGVLVLRRFAPLAVLATTLAAMAVAVALGSEPTGLTTGVGLYTTASMCERRVSLAALVPVAGIAAAMSAATADTEGREASATFGATVAVLLAVGIWGLGAYAQTRRRYTHALRQRAAQAEREREQLATIAAHEERASIARELHDIVAHSVTVMLVGVRGARDVLHTAPAVADETLARVETSGEQSLTELRRILALLRSPDDSAEPRPQPSLAELDQLIAGHRAAGLPVRLEKTGQPRPLPGGVELSVYRIVQEALTNVLKHADPTGVTVTLSFRCSRLELEIVDDAARHTDHSDATTGHGIVGMRERVALLGGELETGRRVGGGYRVAAWLPVHGEP